MSIRISARLESSDFRCDDLRVHRVTGREAIGQLFSFDVELVSLSDPGETHPLTGAAATLVFVRGDGGGAAHPDRSSAPLEVRRVEGIIAEVEDALDTETSSRHLRLVLVPRAFRLTLVKTQEIFLGLSVPEIIKKKLALVGIDAQDVELHLAGTYPKRDFVVQYEETDLAFVSRLAEHVGIGITFAHDRVVLSDRGYGAAEPVHYRGKGDKQGVYRIARRTRLVPRVHIARDYNYVTPLLDVTGKATVPSGHGGGVVEYSPNVSTPEEAAALAAIRAEEHEAAHAKFVGAASLPELTAGGVVKLLDHASLGDRELLVTSVEHRLTQTVGLHGHGGDADSYEATFHAVDASRTYRPPRVTPRPRIHGVVTATIEPETQGDTTPYAKIDTQGRYTVRFVFDTADHGSARPSLPVRMLQPHAGPGYGVHMPLKPGVEVLVAFLDGDPDRPVIVGAAPNAVNASPVARRSNTTHRIRTETGVLIELKDGGGS